MVMAAAAGSRAGFAAGSTRVTAGGLVLSPGAPSRRRFLRRHAGRLGCRVEGSDGRSLYFVAGGETRTLVHPLQRSRCDVKAFRQFFESRPVSQLRKRRLLPEIL